jgi:LmbE family N-acetylglucosaminyl deacetylase
MKALLLLLALATTITAVAQKGKTILAVFAHPDDEQTVGPVLAKYAAEGANVYLMTVTDGRYGTAEHAHIPAGDSLVAVRTREIKCAALQLGIHPPILLGLHDQLEVDSKYYGGVWKSLDSVRHAFTMAMMSLQPDVVITWGPSGWTGHPDHRLVGDVVTETFITRQWPNHPQLYFEEMPNGSMTKETSFFGTVDSSFLTVRVPLSAQDLAKGKAGWSCHQSQYTPATINTIHNALWNPAKPVAYFRPLVFTGKMKTSLFED